MMSITIVDTKAEEPSEYDRSMQESRVSAGTRHGRTASDREASTAPSFGRFYYQYDCGTPYGRSPDWMQHFDELADHIVDRLQPARVLDAGCAMGLLVEKLRERGVDAWGIDVSEFAIGEVHADIQPSCAVRSLIDELPADFPQRYDLVTCIEVVEHMSSADGEAAISRLATLGDRVLFSSSPEDFGEATRVNVQPPEHWSALFARAGHLRNVDFSGDVPTPWTMLYERATSDVIEVVRRYDRRLSRSIMEVREVRETAIRLQGRVAHLAATDAGSAIAERDAARARVAELETEIARLRAILNTRGGRLLRALQAARIVKRQSV